MKNENLDRLLTAASEFDASDLHLVAGVPPAFRVNGEIILADEDALTEAELNAHRREPAQRAAEEEVRAGMGALHFTAAPDRRARPGHVLSAQRASRR